MKRAYANGMRQLRRFSFMAETVNLKHLPPKPPKPKGALFTLPPETKKEPPKEIPKEKKPIFVIPADASLITEWPSQTSLEYERTSKWYWGVGGVALLLSAFALFTNNYLFFIFILITLFYIFTTFRRAPTLFTIEVYDKGIHAQNKWYPFHEYENFSLIELGNECIELFMQPKKKFQLPLDFYMHTSSREEAKEVLLEYLHQIERAESFIHLLGRVLQF